MRPGGPVESLDAIGWPGNAISGHVKAPEGGHVDVGLMPFSDSKGTASIYKPHMFRASQPCWKSRHEYKALTLFFSSNIKKTNLPTYKSVFQVTKEKGNMTPCFIFCGFLKLVFFVKEENRKEKKREGRTLILLTESIVIVNCVYSFYL